MEKIRSIPMVFNYTMFGNHVLAAMREHGLQNRDLAILAETSSSVVSRVTVANANNMELKTVLKVCNALDLDPRIFFELES